MNAYNVVKLNESTDFITYEVTVPKDASNGKGHVTRTDRDSTIVHYSAKYYSVEKDTLVVDKSTYTKDGRMSETDALEVLNKVVGGKGVKITIDAIDYMNAGTVGIPVEVFTALARPIERPQSQQK